MVFFLFDLKTCSAGPLACTLWGRPDPAGMTPDLVFPCGADCDGADCNRADCDAADCNGANCNGAGLDGTDFWAGFEVTGCARKGIGCDRFSPSSTGDNEGLTSNSCKVAPAPCTIFMVDSHPVTWESFVWSIDWWYRWMTTLNQYVHCGCINAYSWCLIHWASLLK